MTTEVSTLPSLRAQAERLLYLGVHRIAGLSDHELLSATAVLEGVSGLLVIQPERAPASRLAPLLRLGDTPGFVVTDMTDVDDFSAISVAPVPPTPIYVVEGVDRGDDMANWSPNEALVAIVGRGRTPLLLTEGLHWLLQQPSVLERNRCFMTIGSRLTKPDGALDSRTPALWISNGTGRDGAANRGAPKVGWCWAGNRHTWLGFASARGRISVS